METKGYIRWRLILANPVLFLTGVTFMGLCAYMGGYMVVAAYMIFRAVVCPH